jgi:hypothetical protein
MTDDDILLRMDQGIPAASPEEAERRAPYERLIARIRDMPDDPLPSGWEKRAALRLLLLRRIRRAAITFVLVIGAVIAAVATCSCAHVDRAAIVASTATMACDWAQTRSAASQGWTWIERGERMRAAEQNPLLGPSPGVASVDAYFAAATAINLAVYALLPRRYRGVIPLVVTAAETRAIVGNYAEDRRSLTGMCGIGAGSLR